jgi:hypothetical protein
MTNAAAPTRKPGRISASFTIRQERTTVILRRPLPVSTSQPRKEPVREPREGNDCNRRRREYVLAAGLDSLHLHSKPLDGPRHQDQASVRHEPGGTFPPKTTRRCSLTTCARTASHTKRRRRACCSGIKLALDKSIRSYRWGTP